MQQLDMNFILSGPQQAGLIVIDLPDAGITWQGDVIELEQTLIDAKKVYYLTEDSGYTDNDYDLLEDMLKSLKPDSKVITGVGLLDAPEDALVKVKHLRMMGSLSKIKTAAELVKFLKTFNGVQFLLAMCKLDGLALTLQYVNGKFVRALTRGTGTVGEDVTHNALTIGGIVKQLPSDFTGEVRGECIIKRAMFNKINAERLAAGQKPFKNPRNAAAGGLSQKDSSICAERHLSFIAYNCLSDNEIPFLSQRFEFLMQQGFEVVPYEITSSTEVEYLIQTKFYQGKDFGFDTDGVVISANNLGKFEQEMGFKDNRPCFATAWKWQAETKTSRVLAIDWQVGRTGKIVPVLRIEPVELSGATVTSVSLYNADFIIKYQITVGCVISIMRSGEVIPKCLGRVSTAMKSMQDIENDLPDECPECHGATEFDDTQLWCTNPTCRAKEVRRLQYFAQAAEMKGVGESVVNDLYEAGIVTRVHHFYQMFNNYDDEVLAAAAGGHGVLRNIKKAILGKSEFTEIELIKCLGIEGVGEGTAERVIEAMGLDNAMMTATIDAVDMFTAIKDVGPTTAKNLCKGLMAHVDEIDMMRKICKVTPPVVKAQVIGKLTGKKFLITGTLSQKRQVIEAEIEAAGGEMVSSVKKDADFFLILGEEGEGSSKHQKAEKVGANIISETELRSMMNA